MSTIEITLGDDPRNSDEFSEIRQEVNKINHPDRPKVDWDKMELLCRRLFKKNGVDLQTTIYYTLARTKLNALEGFAEGSEMLAALMSQHWATLWPKLNHARADMLEWLNGRIGSDIRYFDITVKDYPIVERCKIALETIKQTLIEHKVTPMPRIVFLLDFISETTEKLEETMAQQAAAPKVEPKPAPPEKPGEPTIKPIQALKHTILEPVKKPTAPKLATTKPKAATSPSLAAMPQPVQPPTLQPEPLPKDSAAFWQGLSIGIVVGLILSCLLYFVIK